MKESLVIEPINSTEEDTKHADRKVSTTKLIPTSSLLMSREAYPETHHETTLAAQPIRDGDEGRAMLQPLHHIRPDQSPSASGTNTNHEPRICAGDPDKNRTINIQETWLSEPDAEKAFWSLLLGGL